MAYQKRTMCHQGLRRNNISWEESKERGIEVGVVLEGLGRG